LVTGSGVLGVEALWRFVCVGPMKAERRGAEGDGGRDSRGRGSEDDKHSASSYLLCCSDVSMHLVGVGTDMQSTPRYGWCVNDWFLIFMTIGAYPTNIPTSSSGPQSHVNKPGQYSGRQCFQAVTLYPCLHATVNHRT
jgi:hypothetical protein